MDIKCPNSLGILPGDKYKNGENMKANTVSLGILLLFTGIANVFATAQFGEHLEYEGKDIVMFSEPLRPFLATLKKSPFASRCSACWRGYIGEWKIEGNKLFLVRLRAGVPIEKDYTPGRVPEAFTVQPGKSDDIPLKIFFKDEANPVFASWYSGIIRVPQGKLLDYEHMGYESTFESDLMLLLSHGILIGRFTLDNSKSPVEMLKSFEAAKEEFKGTITADNILNEAFEGECQMLRQRINREPGE